MTLEIISLLIIATYTVAVCIKQKGVPYSISATFYKLKHRLWFMSTMWLTSGLLMPGILEASKPGTEFLAFLACAGMLFVGAAPNFREEFEGKVHQAGAIMCVVFSQLWVAFNLWQALFIWLGYIGYTVYAIAKQDKGVFLYKLYQTKPMFWVEIFALLTTYVTYAMYNMLSKSL